MVDAQRPLRLLLHFVASPLRRWENPVPELLFPLRRWKKLRMSAMDEKQVTRGKR